MIKELEAALAPAHLTAIRLLETAFIENERQCDLFIQLLHTQLDNAYNEGKLAALKEFVNDLRA